MAYTDDAVKAKLSALNETQESIVTVAQWVMFHRYGNFVVAILPSPSTIDILYAGDTQIAPGHYGFSDSRILAPTNDSIWSTLRMKSRSNPRLEGRMISSSHSLPSSPRLQPLRTKELQMKFSRSYDG